MVFARFVTNVRLSFDLAFSKNWTFLRSSPQHKTFFIFHYFLLFLIYGLCARSLLNNTFHYSGQIFAHVIWNFTKYTRFCQLCLAERNKFRAFFFSRARCHRVQCVSGRSLCIERCAQSAAALKCLSNAGRYKIEFVSTHARTCCCNQSIVLLKRIAFSTETKAGWAAAKNAVRIH